MRRASDAKVDQGAGFGNTSDRVFIRPDRVAAFLEARVERIRGTHKQLHDLGFGQEHSAAKVLYYEDLVAFEYLPQMHVDVGGDGLTQSATEWCSLLSSWGLQPEQSTVLSILRRYASTRTLPRPHSTSIANFAEVHMALKQAGSTLASFVRGARSLESA